jgi:hypothetical protein
MGLKNEEKWGKKSGKMGLKMRKMGLKNEENGIKNVCKIISNLREMCLTNNSSETASICGGCKSK